MRKFHEPFVIMFLITLKILFLLAATAAAKSIKEEELPDLKWAKQYSFEATKSSLTSALVEDISYWRTSKKCRIDYNKGATKIIFEKGSRRGSPGAVYKLHPETTDEYTNKIVCAKRKGKPAQLVKLQDILPSTKDFTHVGKDILDTGEVQKFVYEDEEEINKKIKKVLWASLDKKSSTWIPVKLEELEFSTWLGNLKSHYVWNIFNYDTEVDSSVFDVEEYDCTEDTSRIASQIDVNNKVHVDFAFEMYKDAHNKQYQDENEHEMRRKIFEENLRLIQAHNRKNNSFSLGINKFTDQTPEEMRRRKGLIRRKEGEVGNVPFPYTTSKIGEIAETLPKQYDLRLLGVISPVGDQEDCGSCWTFGTTAAVEGALARNNGGRLLRLANQALVDCAWGYSNGCDGGSDTGAYRWMMEYGLPTVEEYGPYKNRDGFCQIENMTVTYPIKGFTDVTPFSVEALKVALVNHGPLSVSIDATDILKVYTGGVLYDASCNPSALNHEVTLVGYGEQDGESYWIVRNSWGTSWGIDGYFHISTRDNSCGITTEPTYVVF